MLYFILACLGEKDNSIIDTQKQEWLNLSPVEKGPYNIGYRSWSHVYSDAIGEERIIDINIWYPSEESDGDDVAYMGFIEDSEVFQGVSLANPALYNEHPMMVFSHGNFGYGANSAFLMRHFASHGWVAAAPDHRGNMVSDFAEEIAPSIRHWRPTDDSETINAVADQPWLAEVNTEAVVLAGHSYGAYDGWLLSGGNLDLQALEEICAEGTGMTRPCSPEEHAALQESFKDERIFGMIPMAGAQNFAWFGDSGRANISIPILQLSGTRDEDEPQRIWDNKGSTPMRWIELIGGCHQAFALGACTEMSNEDAFGITQSYALAFGREVLLGDSHMADVLEGAEDLGWSEQLKFHVSE